MTVDIATLALRVDALEVESAERRLDKLAASGGRAEKATDSLTGAFKALASALAAVKLVDVIKESALAAARYETMGAAMVTVGRNAGYTAGQMAEYEQSLRSTGIAMTEARETLTKMVGAHIDLASAAKLARVAQDAAVIGNINSSEAFSRMIDGLRSGEIEILKTIGLNVNFEQAYKKAADQLGKNSDQLTALEKVQARVNDALQAGAAIGGAYESAMGTAGKQINSLKRFHDDLKVSIGAVFGPTLTMLVEQYGGALKSAAKGVEENRAEVNQLGNAFRTVVIYIEGLLQSLLDKIFQVGQAVASVVKATAGAYDMLRSIPGSVSDMYSAMGGGEVDGYKESGFSKFATEMEGFFAGMKEAGVANANALAAELEKVGEVSLKATPKVKAIAQAEDAAGAAGGNAAKAAKEHAAALREQEKAAREAREAVEKIADAYRTEAQYQDDIAVAMMTSREREIHDIQQANEELNSKINYLVRERGLSEEVAQVWRDKLGANMAEDVRAVNDELNGMNGMFEDVAKNIQGAFASMFEDMLDGSSNFIDNLWQMFKKLIAQMATLAIANPIIVPVVTTVGTAMGVSTSTIASTLGVSNSSISGLSGLSGLSSLFSSGSLGGIGVSGLTGIADIAYNLGANSVGNIAIDAASWLNSLSGGLADGLTAGVGSLAMSLLSGQGLTASTGLQAAGSVLGGVLGFGAPGAIIGGFLGNMLGGLFGDNGPDTFRWSPAAEIHASDWNTESGGLTLSDYEWTRTDTDGRLYKVFGQQIESIQAAFNDQVVEIAEAMPDVLADAMLAELEKADLSGLLTSSSLGEYEVSKASESLEAIAKKYSSGLIEALGEAYATALGDYIADNGAASLVGNSQVWNALTGAARSNIESAFSEAADALQGGDFESGLSTLSNIASAISSIASAMAPITEILETAGLSDYEKQVRAVNKQFDAYAEALENAGVDLSKYTELEKARAIALEQIVDPAIQEAIDAEIALADARKDAAKTTLDAAEGVLRRSFDAQREVVAAQYDASVAQINGQLGLANSTLSGMQSLYSALDSSVSGMSGTGPGSSGSYQQARAALASALKGAKAGSMAEAEGLVSGNTLSILQQRGTDSYASAADYRRDYWATYLSLAELKTITGDQISEAEKSVELLEQQLSNAEAWRDSQLAALDEQLNAIMGVDTSVKDLSVAIGEYTLALYDYMAASQDLERVSGSYATGIEYVPRTMVARIHEGERIVPASQNRADTSNAAIVDLLRQVVAEVRATGVANAKASGKMAEILDAWDGDGMPETRTVA